MSERTTEGQGRPVPQHGRWDDGLKVFGHVLRYVVAAALVLLLFRGDLPLGTTALYVLVGAGVGALVGLPAYRTRYGAFVVVGVLLAGVQLLGYLFETRPPLGVFVVGYLLGLRLTRYWTYRNRPQGGIVPLPWARGERER